MIPGAVTRLTRKAAKLARILSAGDPLWLRALRHGVAAGVEHVPMLRTIRPASVVDIGANRGQFALGVKHVHPRARIFSFEPLATPAAAWRQVFAGVDSVELHQYAVGDRSGCARMFVTYEDDSSSLFEPSGLQTELAPGSRVVGREVVPVRPLAQVLDLDSLPAPGLLKIDVQGSEYQVIRGSAIDHPVWRWLYVESSFRPLYSGQVTADRIVCALIEAGYRLTGIFNPWVASRTCVQADFLFERG